MWYSNHNSKISDNDPNNIKSGNNCNNDNNNNKENNSIPPNKNNRNYSISRVKHKIKKAKDNFNSNNDSDNNNFYNGGNKNKNPLDTKNHVRHVNNTRNTVFVLGDSILKNLNGYLLTKKLQNRKLKLYC